MRRAAIVAVAGAALAAAVPASADQRVQAQTRDRYGNPNVTIDQGERLTFLNGDLLDDHGVTATALGPSGRPLFDSGTIGPGQEAIVEGAQFLPPGRYAFYCTVHSFMTGTVTVTGAGVRAAPRADATPAHVGVTVGTGSLDTVLRTGRLPARARADEASTVRLVASTRVSGRNVTLGSATVTLPGAASRAVSIVVGAAARRALARTRSVSVSLTGNATDRAGNASAATTRRFLSRR